MTVYVLGGSNSVFKHGWVSHVQAEFPDTVNLSVGASNSVMGLFRFLQTESIGPGDIVVWAYSIGDTLVRERRDISREYLLEALEHLLCLTRDAGAAFAPLIISPRDAELEGTADDGNAPFKALFEAYGVPWTDVNQDLRAELGLPRLLPEHYVDALHYAPKLRPFLGKAAIRCIAAAERPAAIPPREISGQRIVILNDFTDHYLTNRLMSIPVGDGPVSLTLPEKGEVLGAFFVTTIANRNFHMFLKPGFGRLRRSTTSAKSEKAKPHLRGAYPAYGGKARWTYEAGARLTVGSIIPSSRMHHAIKTLRAVLRLRQDPDRHMRVAAVLVALHD